MLIGILYIVFIILLTLFMNWFAFSKKGNNHKVTFVLRELSCVVTFSIIAGVCATFIPNINLALFVKTLHYASVEWMLIFFVRFLELYTNHLKVTMPMRLTFMMLSTLSSISLILNFIFHHVVRAEKITEGNIVINQFEILSPGYTIHFAFSYVLVLIFFLVLAYTLIRTVKLYRKKYALVLLILSFTAGVKGICIAMEFSLDYSLFGYILAEILLTFFSLYYQPKGVVNRTLAYVATNSHNAVMCFDPEDNCIYANEVARLMNSKATSLSEYKEEMMKILEVERFSDLEDQTWHKQIEINKNLLRSEITFAKLYDERDNYIGCYFIIVDRTEEVEKFERERYRATHDSLTGLYNKEYFYQKVSKMVKYNPDKDYYVICIDIKDFKLINDLFGYEKGDTVLKKVSSILSESLPENTVTARLSADHFAICIPKERYREDYLKECMVLAQDIIGDFEFKVRFVAGIYQTNPKQTDVSRMCDYANMAIQSIKNDYDKSIAYYDKKIMDKVRKDNGLIGEFENALKQKHFAIYLQPQVNQDGEVLGAEALVRWIHPQKGMISPGDFIPVFEESGLIHKLDMYVWDLAAQKISEWKKRGKDKIYLSVNISARDFYYIDLYKTFTEIVEKYDISPKNLKLEITETAIMQDTELQLEILAKLRNYGFEVEIDDFGSGYSSLNMLKNISVDVLKIDMGFLQEVRDQMRTKIILDMVVNLAKKLKMLVITEGVEEKEQISYLKSIGCDMFQGYYYEKPIPVSEFEEKYLK